MTLVAKQPIIVASSTDLKTRQKTARGGERSLSNFCSSEWMSAIFGRADVHDLCCGRAIEDRWGASTLTRSHTNVGPSVRLDADTGKRRLLLSKSIPRESPLEYWSELRLIMQSDAP